MNTGTAVGGISFASTMLQTAPAERLRSASDLIGWRAGPKMIGGTILRGMQNVVSPSLSPNWNSKENRT